MRQTFIVILLIVYSSFSAVACTCSSAWNDSFIRTAKYYEFVALVKVISFDEYLEDEILGFDSKMPYSMTVEIIKKYKGKEHRDKIIIYGDDGMLCRPYLSNFEINAYYLIAPNPLDKNPNTDYYFNICVSEYLDVDIVKNKAFGNYSLLRKQVDISKFEERLKQRDWDLEILGSIVILVILFFFIVQRNKKLKTPGLAAFTK